MSMTIGRCTITTDPLAGSLRLDGDRMSFAFYVFGVAQAGTVVDDMKAKVQQLRGLMDNEDEDVFPCTFSADSAFDGFYDSFDVRIEDHPTMYVSGKCKVSVSCRRVAGASAARMENTYSVVVQTNGHSLPTTAQEHLLAIPIVSGFASATDARNVSTGTSVADFDDGVTVTVDGGSIRRADPDATPTTARFMWTVPPASFYIGSCMIEQSYGGTYYPIHGQQMLPVSNSWRVSNGLTRVSILTSGSSRLRLEFYDGSTWEAKDWNIEIGGGGEGFAALHSITVMRNTPHSAVVRVVAQSSDISLPPECTFDISLRRGAPFASFVLQRDDSPQFLLNMSAEAGTLITGGVKATSADAAGNKYVIASPQAITRATTPSLTLTGSTSFRFMIGSEIGAGGDAATIVDRYINATTEDQRVISR